MEELDQNQSQPEVQNNAPEPTPGVAEQAPDAVQEQPDADQNEWDEVTKEVLNVTPPGEEGTEAKPAEGDQPTPPAPTTEEPKKTEEAPAVEAQPNSPEAAMREIRMAQRRIAEQTDAVKNDIRQVMFKDVPTELRDGEGDPIRSPQDVMKLIDPRTGEAFTEEAATEYFNYASQQLQTRLSQIEQQVDTIASINVAIKDEADVINEQYGDLLRSMPDVQKQLWAEYQKTLTIDPNTGVILRAPVSLASFYNVALQPYKHLTVANQQAQQASQEAARQAEEAKKQAEETKRLQTRSDRSDIYASGKTDNMDPEEKEWREAAKEYFG